MIVSTLKLRVYCSAFDSHTDDSTYLWTGKRMVNKLYRGGEVINKAAINYWDFEQNGAGAVRQEPYTLKMGDSYKTSCYYESYDGTKFGLGSEDEMCMSFIYYFPKQPNFFGCDSDSKIEACQGEYSTRTLDPDSDFNRDFTNLPATASPSNLSSPPSAVPSAIPSISSLPSVSPSFTNAPSESCIAVTVQIRPDEYTYAISWELTDPDGDIIVSAGTNSSDSQKIFMDLIPYTLYRYDTCLPLLCEVDDGSHEYKFEIFDHHVDGLILENTALDSGFTISVDNIRMLGDSDGRDGYNDTIVFSTCPEDKLPSFALSPRPITLQSSQPTSLISQSPLISTTSPPSEQIASSSIKPNQPSLITHILLPFVLVLRGILK